MAGTIDNIMEKLKESEEEIEIENLINKKGGIRKTWKSLTKNNMIN